MPLNEKPSSNIETYSVVQNANMSIKYLIIMSAQNAVYFNFLALEKKLPETRKKV